MIPVAPRTLLARLRSSARLAVLMGAGHDHGVGEIKHERPLWWAFRLTLAFLIAEVIAGLFTNPDSVATRLPGYLTSSSSSSLSSRPRTAP